jgi:hypothetical protein
MKKSAMLKPSGQGKPRAAKALWAARPGPEYRTLPVSRRRRSSKRLKMREEGLWGVVRKEEG